VNTVSPELELYRHSISSDGSSAAITMPNQAVSLRSVQPNALGNRPSSAGARETSVVTRVHPFSAPIPDTTATAAISLPELNVTVPVGVEATAHNGNLTLTGTVSYGTQRAAAELAVAGLTGVRNVKDDIEVRHGANLARVTANVRDTLARYAMFDDDSDVAVDTRGNTAMLSGHVGTWAEHNAVVNAVWMTAGVYDVLDDLEVTG
jgi:osmotically-inducible protein OsmY